jgi:hypothetical protein
MQRKAHEMILTLRGRIPGEVAIFPFRTNAIDRL